LSISVIAYFGVNYSFLEVCNFGQSELLLNFACNARAKGLDIGNVLVFATDQETKTLAESVGLTAYFDERVSKTQIGGALIRCDLDNSYDIAVVAELW
jgi:hypothetical protein